MQKLFYVIVLIAVLASCSFDSSWDSSSYAIVIEGPLREGGFIGQGQYECCIKILNSKVDIIITQNNGLVDINGFQFFSTSEDGCTWFMLSISNFNENDVFSIELNGDIMEFTIL